MSTKTAARNLRVHLEERSYPIRIGYGCLAAAGPAIAEATKSTRVAIVLVAPVATRYAAKLERSLRQLKQS